VCRRLSQVVAFVRIHTHLLAVLLICSRAKTVATGLGFLGEQGGRLVGDLTIRQCLLESGHTGVGDLGVADPERLQILQPLEVHQPGVGDFGTGQVKPLKAR